MKLLKIRDDITGKFYNSREALDADRKANAEAIWPAWEEKIIAQVDSLPAEIAATYKDTDEITGVTTPMDLESIKAQNIAVVRYKLGLE